jgi:hypothetical protein
LAALISIYCSIIGVAEARLSSEASSAALKTSFAGAVLIVTGQSFLEKDVGQH